MSLVLNLSGVTMSLKFDFNDVNANATHQQLCYSLASPYAMRHFNFTDRRIGDVFSSNSASAHTPKLTSDTATDSASLGRKLSASIEQDWSNHISHRIIGITEEMLLIGPMFEAQMLKYQLESAFKQAEDALAKRQLIIEDEPFSSLEKLVAKARESLAKGYTLAEDAPQALKAALEKDQKEKSAASQSAASATSTPASATTAASSPQTTASTIEDTNADDDYVFIGANGEETKAADEYTHMEEVD